MCLSEASMLSSSPPKVLHARYKKRTASVTKDMGKIVGEDSLPSRKLVVGYFLGAKPFGCRAKRHNSRHANSR